MATNAPSHSHTYVIREPVYVSDGAGGLVPSWQQEIAWRHKADMARQQAMIAHSNWYSSTGGGGGAGQPISAIGYAVPSSNNYQSQSLMHHAPHLTEKELSAVTVLEKPKRIVVAPQKDERLVEYASLAKSLGLDNYTITGKLLQQQVADFFWEQDIEMYDLKQVVAYMIGVVEKEAEARKQNFKLCWKPLRRQDCEKISWGIDTNHDHSHRWQYDKLVPFEILQNVKKLNDKFGEQVQVFVSDYAVPTPDPFILVTARGMDRIVFGVWDEPGFFKNK